jgi:hypothetical protein
VYSATLCTQPRCFYQPSCAHVISRVAGVTESWPGVSNTGCPTSTICSVLPPNAAPAALALPAADCCGCRQQSEPAHVTTPRTHNKQPQHRSPTSHAAGRSYTRCKQPYTFSSCRHSQQHLERTWAPHPASQQKAPRPGCQQIGLATVLDCSCCTGLLNPACSWLHISRHLRAV